MKTLRGNIMAESSKENSHSSTSLGHPNIISQASTSQIASELIAVNDVSSSDLNALDNKNVSEINKLKRGVKRKLENIDSNNNKNNTVAREQCSTTHKNIISNSTLSKIVAEPNCIGISCTNAISSFEAKNKEAAEISSSGSASDENNSSGNAITNITLPDHSCRRRLAAQTGVADAGAGAKDVVLHHHTKAMRETAACEGNKSSPIKSSHTPVCAATNFQTDSSRLTQLGSDCQHDNAEAGTRCHNDRNCLKGDNILNNSKSTSNINTCNRNNVTTSTDTSSRSEKKAEINKKSNNICNIDRLSPVNNNSDYTSTIERSEKTTSNFDTIPNSNNSTHPIINTTLSHNNSNNINTSNSTNDNNRGVLSDRNSPSRPSQTSEGHPLQSRTPNRKVYGLRPRSSMRRLWSGPSKERKCSTSSDDLPESQLEQKATTDDDSSPPAKLKHNNGNTQNNNNTGIIGGGQNISTAKSNNNSSKGRTPRSKPLSKYRRITANARERDRMKEINTAFATLRSALPTFTNCRISSMTKHTTLQLAASYIRGLSELLEETSPNGGNSNKKENRPSLCNAAITSNTGRDINLSVGISEIPYDRSQQASTGDKQTEFNGVNTFSNLADNQLDSLSDIDNLNDMCWTLDFMLD